MATGSPAFQFYPKDWLSSLHVQAMTPAQEGAYIRLLCYCWDSGDCSLPDDDELLSRISRLFEGWYSGGSVVVRKCFVQHPSKPGFLSNIRMLQEAEKQAAWRRKSSEGGKQAAETRKHSKGGTTKLQPNGNQHPSLQSPVSILHKERKESTASDEQAAERCAFFGKVFEYITSKYPSLMIKNPSEIHRWEAAGFKFIEQIKPVVDSVLAKGITPKSFSYFTPAITDASIPLAKTASASQSSKYVRQKPTAVTLSAGGANADRHEA